MDANQTVANLFLSTTEKYSSRNAIGFFDNKIINHISFKKYKDIIEESDFNERDWKKLLDENSDSDSWQE